MELAKAYNPQEAQAKWLAFWDERGYFHSRPDSRKPFTIVIPPPNVTGALHMGHALNNTLQDVLIRWRRMQGYNALWMPGTDHAGIATQAVVERLIMQTEKKTRHEIGREDLVRRIWAWKDKYEARILGQLKQLGCSCDWARTRFTLDPICARAVRETFFNMFKAGLIFRGKRLVNWDTSLQTSVADDETYTEDTKGGFWTFKYPVRDEGQGTRGEENAALAPHHSPLYISFSTTRPETMLGDTAVCVHPSDERYKHLIGKHVHIPLVNRDIPIIADALLADPTLGTGCVKVTPAHDPNDYACYTRNPHIGMINILNPDGTINENGGKYTGLDRYKAREAIVTDMEALGLFEGKEERVIPLKYSDRSKTPIEPYLSDQWFVKMGDSSPLPPGEGRKGLARMAMEAVENGHVQFFPERYKNSYLDWLAEKRDWCISRQLWWGHRIPVWTKRFEDYSEMVSTRLAGNQAIFPSYYESGALFPAFENRDHAQISEDIADHVWMQAEKPADSMAWTVRLCVSPGHEELERQLEAVGFTQDPDVLDTWFSSMLWPHSTLGWPEKTPELEYYYPTSVLVTSRDIITLWVARMVIAGLYNLHHVPFHQVYITVKLMDGFGETMSKSKGNGVDPLDIIDRYGADALRFLIMQISTETQDARMPVANVCPHCDALVPVKQEHMYMRTKKLACPNCKQPFRPGGPWPSDDPDLKTAKQASERFEIGRNFANKIWNAARFILMNLDGYTPQAIRREELPLEDRWILSRLASATKDVTEQLEGFRFSDAVRTLYDFIWSEFCDWYLEMAKGRLRRDEGGRMKDGTLAAFIDVKSVKLTDVTIPPAVLELVPEGMARENVIIPLSLDGRSLQIAVSDPTDFDTLTKLQFILEKDIQPVLAPREQIIAAINRHYGQSDTDRNTVQRVLVGVLDAIVRLIQPIMPFVAESIWSALNDVAFERGLPGPEPATESVVIAPWPEFPADWRDGAIEGNIAHMQELVRSVREVRNRYNIEPRTPLDTFVKCGPAIASNFATLAPFIKLLAGVGELQCGPDVKKPPQPASHVTPEFEVYVSLAGLIDPAAETKRLDKQLADKKKQLAGAEAKLKNESFVKNAPPEVVEQQRALVADLQKQIATIEQNIRDLQQ
ncbi:MAG: valine--tRNA ligase [Planctomycetes bacterium]|nr:valine--tRNA ligase [Planctomycetota bacterium]